MDFKDPSTIMKLVEMVLTIICIIIDSTEKCFGLFVNLSSQRVAYGGLLMGFIISGVLLISFLQGHRGKIQSTPLDIMFTAVTGLLLLGAGSDLIHSANKVKFIDVKSPLAVGSLCVIAAVAYLADTALAVMACRANA